MTPTIWLIEPTAAEMSAWIDCTRWLISSLSRYASCASSLTSVATTAKPLPTTPARTASMVASRASRFVCSATPEMTLTMSLISAELVPGAELAVSVEAARSTAPRPASRRSIGAAKSLAWASTTITQSHGA
jgi:hypothetical protein